MLKTEGIYNRPYALFIILISFLDNRPMCSDKINPCWPKKSDEPTQVNNALPKSGISCMHLFPWYVLACIRWNQNQIWYQWWLGQDQDPAVCGMVVENHLCTFYVMDLLFNGQYRILELYRFRLAETILTISCCYQLFWKSSIILPKLSKPLQHIYIVSSTLKKKTIKPASCEVCATIPLPLIKILSHCRNIW